MRRPGCGLLDLGPAASALHPQPPGQHAAALVGTQVRADNIIISDFSTVRLTGPTFSDSGFLSVQSFQLGGTTVVAGGLNSTYGLFFEFSGMASTDTAAIRPAAPTFGQFSSLNYTLYGYNGPAATFGFDASDNPTMSAGAAVARRARDGFAVAG